ncbi:phage tail tape measure protein [Ligilactobacillus equi]|uniref:TP901 family phage tail tape measure protein n=1 Tax=Ligilactobacillus equi DSM 15833 = JCM 10991 TaxID=1423740 RepID=A0A0R1TDL8_9LACO|nr:phage tail tape measure protein [Ligilactobacillus equi]KRL76613.1 TP901 family phage tail tape measure protein [Ligilactobacillus equi DSM 15833 = JCM 10991]
MGASLGHLAATVELNINPFKSNASALKAQIRATTSALKAQDTALRGNKNNLNAMRASYATMQSQMRNYEALLKKQMATYNQLKGKTAETASEQQKLSTRQANAANQVNKTSAAMEALRNRMSSLSGQIAVQSSRWTQLGSKLTSIGEKIQSVSSKIQGFGQSMTTHITAPIAAGIGYGAKKLIEFDGTMNNTKNLIRQGGESVQETMSGINRMTSDAEKYSNKYGISQTKIAQGYQDLVKRGYTSKQAIGAMNAELQASVATGDDFSEVTSVASQTLEAFGMKSNSVAGMTRNTKAVVNSLAYAADATSTGFQDLGVAMSYVGSTAHSAGFSLAETSSAIGILSNNGLEADKAGTGLRKVINSLISPTTGAKNALQKLGLSTKDFIDKSGKMKSMTEIFGTLNKHMKGLTQSQKNDIFHSIFGTTGQQAALILAQNSEELGKLTKKVQEAAGKDYVGKLSESNLKSAQNQIRIFKESLTNMMMQVARVILPIITPIIQKISELAQKFGELSPGMQKLITYAALGVAALGPLISVIGSVGTAVGGLLKAGGSLATWLGKIAGKRAAATTIAEIGTSAAGSVGGLTSMTGATTGATAALGGLGPMLATVGVAIVAGIAYYELFGKKIAQNNAEIGQWGTKVGSETNKALSSFKQTTTGINQALTDMTTAGETSTKQLADSFDKQFAQIEKQAKDHVEKVKASVKDMPKEVQNAAAETATKEQQTMNKSLDNLKNYKQQYQAILKGHHGTVRDLDANQRVALLNIEQGMQNEMLNVLRISGSKRKTILAALNADYKNMNQQQRQDTLTTLKQSEADTIKSYAKRSKELKKMHEEGKLTTAEYNASMKALRQADQKTINQIADAYYKCAKASGMSAQQIKDSMREAGLSYDQAKARADEMAKVTSNSSAIMVAKTNDMSNSVKKAADMWNGLVFDPKTGKIKTNAIDEVEKAVQSKNKWNQIQLLEKEGKLSSNAKEMVADALLSTGKWNSLSLKEQKAWIKSNVGKTMVEAMEKTGQWNSLSLQAKEAIVNAKGLPQLADAVAKYKLWNGLPTTVKQLLANDANASAILKQAGINIDEYNRKHPEHKSLTGDSNSVDQASQKGKNSIFGFNSTNPLHKPMTGDSNSVDNASRRGRSSIGAFNGTNPKHKPFTGNSSSVDSASGRGRSSIGSFNGTNPNHKNFRGTDYTSGAARRAISAISSFNAMRTWTKTLTTVYQTIHEVITRRKGRAKGTNYHEGGPMLVNDQPGPVFREAVQFPGQPAFIPFGRNVPIDNAPRGTKVIKASETAKLFGNLPQYANGTAHAVDVAKGLSKSVKATPVSLEATNVIDNSGVESNQQTLINLVGAILSELSKPGNDNQREALRTVMQGMDQLTNQRVRGRLS